MPIVGVRCPADNTYQSFAHCISCHEERKTRSCHAPVFTLKSMRDNHITRIDAGISMSTLISCPREVAIIQSYDVYEDVISGYNKARGSWTHAMIETDVDPPEWIVRERRLYVELLGERITGQPDEVDTKYKILVDYKSKDNLPRDHDKGHEFQFNGYAYLLGEGYWQDTGEKANIDIEVIGAHYLTWKTKTEKAWKKVGFPVWEREKTQQVLMERLLPLISWRDTKILPECSPYVPAVHWKCSCQKYTEQLIERGVELKEDHND